MSGMQIMTRRPRLASYPPFSTERESGTPAQAARSADKGREARSKDGAHITLAPKKGGNGWRGRMAGTAAHLASDPGGANRLGLKKELGQGAGEIRREMAMKERAALHKPDQGISNPPATRLAVEKACRKARAARGARRRRADSARGGGGGNRRRIRTAALDAAARMPLRAAEPPAGRAGGPCSRPARRRALAAGVAPLAQAARCVERGAG